MVENIEKVKGGAMEKEKLLYDTNVEMKQKHWDMFIELIKNQWQYGGVKYGQNDSPGNRESTDILCESFGIKGVLWTMGKYLLRFRNQQREKDLLKVSCYCYILWLKYGFFENETHDEDTGDK